MNNTRDVDLEAIAWDAMERYGFEPGFPDSVVWEVKKIAEEKPKSSPSGVRDMRGLLWSSIDNFDSRDLDQLEYCEQDPDGRIHVRVAIADVDVFVQKDMHTDVHAAHNGTSVYLGIVTFPMLPPALSEDISSLLPGKDRRAIVIEFTVLPDGNLVQGDIFRALVKNKAKLVYEEIGDWLEGTGPAPALLSEIPELEDQIRLQSDTASRLRKHRMEKGALDLETIEAEPVVEDGQVRDLAVQRQNLARQLIEEFMVAANQTMVDMLDSADAPMIQRIVRVPKNWEGIVETVSEYGVSLPKKPDAKALSRFLDRQRAADPESFPDLSLTIVKLMGPGEYVAYVPGDVPVGHFALSIMDYTHSTAPNRRYVDIVNQRILKSILDGKHTPYSTEELDAVSFWLTGREKAAQKAERFMRKAIAAVLLQDRVGEIFDGIVTGASEKGTYARLISPPAEGRIMQGQHGLKVGQKVRVRLTKTDPYKGFVDFECVGRRTRS